MGDKVQKLTLTIVHLEGHHLRRFRFNHNRLQFVNQTSKRNPTPLHTETNNYQRWKYEQLPTTLDSQNTLISRRNITKNQMKIYHISKTLTAIRSNSLPRFQSPASQKVSNPIHYTYTHSHIYRDISIEREKMNNSIQRAEADNFDFEAKQSIGISAMTRSNEVTRTSWLSNVDSKLDLSYDLQIMGKVHWAEPSSKYLWAFKTVGFQRRTFLSFFRVEFISQFCFMYVCICYFIYIQ